MDWHDLYSLRWDRKMKQHMWQERIYIDPILNLQLFFYIMLTWYKFLIYVNPISSYNPTNLTLIPDGIIPKSAGCFGK